MNSADHKQQLRSEMRTRRRALTTADHSAYALAACEVFSAWVKASDFPLALYLSFDGELDPQPIIDSCWEQNQPVFLPVVIPGQGTLQFAEFTPDSRLVENQYGILQPPVENLVRADTLHTLLMPLTAFDASGARLGMGGGYYDKTLAACVKRPKVIGLAYAFQQVDHCPVEAHDEPLDGILTDKEFIDFSDR